MGKDDDNRRGDYKRALDRSFGFAGEASSRPSDLQMEIRTGEVLRQTLMGRSATDIAEDLGIPVSKVATVLRSDAVRGEIKSREKALREAAFRRVKLQADKIMDSIIGMALGEQPDAKAADRLRAAQTALDRIGIAANTGNVNVDIHIGPALTTGELIKRAQAISDELRIIEVEAETVELELEADAGGDDGEA